MNELVHDSRGLLGHPMSIQFLSHEGPKVDLVDVGAMREAASRSPKG